MASPEEVVVVLVTWSSSVKKATDKLTAPPLPVLLVSLSSWCGFLTRGSYLN